MRDSDNGGFGHNLPDEPDIIKKYAGITSATFSLNDFLGMIISLNNNSNENNLSAGLQLLSLECPSLKDPLV